MTPKPAPSRQRFRAQASAAAQLVAKLGTYNYQEVNGFTPNAQDPSGGYYGWTPIGNVVASVYDPSENSIAFAAAGNISVKLYVLGSTAFRVRFNPAAGASYSRSASYAAINSKIEPVNPNVTSTPSL